MTPVSAWGRLSADPQEMVRLTDRDAAPAAIAAIAAGAGHGLAHGLGRSYGDVCLNPGGVLWQMTGLDRFIAFDANSGRLCCEAGVCLRDIQRLMIPRGWMLPVTPGTQWVTVGGAIANDVHGKNHHRRGSFGDHVQQLVLARTDGQRIVCGPDLNREWFVATVAGLGLTGVIIEATLQLQRVAGPWLEAERIAYDNLSEFFTLADASERDWEHTVSWVNCLPGREGRGIFLRANPSEHSGDPLRRSRQRRVPFTPPVSLVNGLSLRLFNNAYFHANRWRAGRFQTDVEAFLYPLDNLLEWNRIYGPNGFYQYQCVLPRAVGADAVQALLREAAHSGGGSFLAVLKTFGDRGSAGLLGFPRPGVTLALDFPNRAEKTLSLLARLDAVVREAGGCLYPAKDNRMPRDLFESGFPKLAEFVSYRDPGISSGFSRRMMGN